MDLKTATVVVQGFGNAGSIAAQLIEKEGSKVLGVSDSTGGIYKPDGLDISRVVAWKAEHGTVAGFPGSQSKTNAEILEIPCDVLIPAALENQITAANAEHINAKIVAEAANGPTTPEADEILFGRGIFLIPDILCNAGGVTVSYFEWVQDLNRDHWSEEVVNQKLHEIMVKAFGETRGHRRARAGAHAHGRVPAGRPARGRCDRDARSLPVIRIPSQLRAGRRRRRPARVIRPIERMSDELYGAQSMTAPLRRVVLRRPGAAFGRAFDDPAHGFLHPVDLPLAQRQHADLRGSADAPRRRRGRA